ncbi:MAG: hypothetical protein HYY06_32380 [Deltaproteobacteria bacterium]|nr:hypothetical protein [Deltaproteobacteria bacterium]
MARLLVGSVVVALVLGGCRCGFDAGKLDELVCSSSEDDCAPDQDCEGGVCVRRECSDADDCGSEHEFRCQEALCHASRCEVGCGAGFVCADDGWCRVAGLDAGLPDAGEDAGSKDGGPEDGGLSDGGVADAGLGDAGLDGGAPDGGDEDGGDGGDDGGGDDGGGDDGGPPDGGTCVESEGCDDGTLCTSGDVCRDGSCEGTPYECTDGDGLSCTVAGCDGLGGCTNGLEDGTCLIDGVCRTAGETRPGNGCEECNPAVAPFVWTVDDSNEPPDAFDCTRDSCAGGQPVHTVDDALCPDGEVCSLCAGGCVALPAMIVDCPAGPTEPGEPGATCTVDLGPGSAGQAACLSCESVVGITALVRDTFEGCPDLQDLGWTVTDEWDNPPDCPAEAQLGPDPDIAEDQLSFENLDLTFDRTVDTRDFDSVRLCFDYADRSMDLADSVAVYLSTGGGFGIAPIWADWGGPGEQDRNWVTVCLDLVESNPAAADNAQVGIRFDLSVWGLGDRAFLDNIVVEAWDSGHVTVGVPVFSNDFTGCDLGEWIEGGPDPVQCPVTDGPNQGEDALEADNATWTITRATDVSAICDDVRFGFRHTTHNPDARDRTTIAFDRGPGPVAAWASYRETGLEEAFTAFEVNLSNVDPNVRFQPELDLLVTQAARDGTLLVDDLWLAGATCESGDDVFDVGEPLDVGGGTYELVVSSPEQSTAHLRCTWDGRSETVARGSVAFGN